MAAHFFTSLGLDVKRFQVSSTAGQRLDVHRWLLRKQTDAMQCKSLSLYLIWRQPQWPVQPMSPHIAIRSPTDANLALVRTAFKNFATLARLLGISCGILAVLAHV